MKQERVKIRDLAKAVKQKLVNISKDMAPQIKYNKDAKIISIRLSNKKSVDSDVKNNIVVDYTEDGEIVNIDVMKVGLDEFKKIRQAVPLRELTKV